MTFGIFRRAAHRIPTLALYKSLLRISSSPSLQPDLSQRIRDLIRTSFRRKSNKLYAPARVKRNLVRAYELHATIERAINGDSNAFKSLIDKFPPKPEIKIESVEEPKVPKKPSQTSFIGWTRAPTIKYAQYTLPIVIYPGYCSVKAGTTFHNKLELVRKWGEWYGFLTNMIWHAEQEEIFLTKLATQLKQNWGYEAEAGRRELKAMRNDIQRLLVDYSLREDIRAEKQLREWVGKHSDAQFLPYGLRIPGRRKELRLWERESKNIKKEHERELYQKQFIQHWRRNFANDSVAIKFAMDEGRRAKIRAKRHRRRHMGKYLL